jgi:hypothetical protein
MSKTNDSSKLDHAKRENHVLADTELGVVSGGMLCLAAPQKSSSSVFRDHSLPSQFHVQVGP